MFTYADCARMADAAYYVTSANPGTPKGTEALRLVKASLVRAFTDDAVMYQAQVWQKNGWMAFVVRGTVPSLVQSANLVQDIMMKLVSGVPYDLARRAVTGIEGTIKPGSGQRWIVVGHSLGGSVAQVLGFVYGVPFVTFDAPGMRYDVMRRGWAKTAEDAGNGIGGKVLSMLPGVRSIYDAGVRATPFLDSSYDQAREEVARNAGSRVSNAGSTAPHDVDKQLGFNIAHSLDTIHNLTGPPIGGPYRSADFTPDYYKAPKLVNAVRGFERALSPVMGLSESVQDILRYHDMRAMADYIDGLNWGTECPVGANNVGGKIEYYAPSYMSTPGWGGRARGQ